MKFGVR
jgi:hypothetical protein